MAASFCIWKSKTFKLRCGILEENPLKEVVKSKYPNIYAAAWSASLVIESELEVRIGEDEVAYLALYIGGAIERLNVGVEVCILLQSWYPEYPEFSKRAD